MEKRQKSKTSYSFVQENERPILTHDELKKDSRAAVRRLSVAFADISMATATGKATPMPPGIFSKSRQLGEFNTYGLYTYIYLQIKISFNIFLIGNVQILLLELTVVIF